MTLKPAILLDMKLENIQSDDLFRKALPDFNLINWADDSQKNADLTPVKYALVWKTERSLLDRCINLEVLFSAGAGVDHLYSEGGLPDKPIVRFVDPHLTEPMVEWTTLQVLMHVRQQRGYDLNQRLRKWHEFPQPMGKEFRVGIMGFGELGRASAQPLRSLGFQINAWSRTPKSEPGVTCFHGQDQIDAFLNSTDILISLLPLTEATRGILNADLIDKLASDGPFGAPILINAGRGGSQVEVDIAAALQDGRLHAASLDVFETEPLPNDSPLWELDNLIITPHAAAVSNPVALAAHTARQIKRYENGEALEFLVDPKQGY